jgi:glycosyltransferase involved in cell wall biosynthesis
MKSPVSLVIITLNEERNIARCIESATFAEEVIVVDSFSRDKTVTIAEKLGAKVIQREFKGYREQKQFAVSQAKGPWILSLDADEALSPSLQFEIMDVLKNPQFDSYRAPRCSYHLGRWIRHGGWYPDYQLRLFRKDRGAWTGGAVHEHVTVAGTTGTLKNDIHHYVFQDLEDQIDTNNEYSTRGAHELINRGEKFSMVRLVLRPLGKFLETFLWKRGFLDGVPGFIISLGAAQSLFLKYAKLWESRLRQK